MASLHETLARDRQIKHAGLAVARAFVARRSFTFHGRTVKAGERFRPKSVTFEKLAQLIEQRYLEAPVVSLRHEATRRFTCQGRAYVPGQAFESQGLRPEKVAQLLEQRFIQPVAAA